MAGCFCRSGCGSACPSAVRQTRPNNGPYQTPPNTNVTTAAARTASQLISRVMAFSRALNRFIAQVRCHRYLPDPVKILSKRSRCDLIFLLAAEMMAQASILGNDNGPDRVVRNQSGPEAKNGRLFMKTLMQAAFAAGAFCL